MLYRNNKRYGKSKVTNIVVVWLFAIATMAALVVAQDSPMGETTVLLAQADPLEGASVEGATAYGTADELMASQAIQSITFNRDMTIRDALRFLALKYQKNIVPTPSVDGPITIVNLYDVTFEEALRAILGTNKYEVQGNFIMVYSLEEFQADKSRMESRIFTLYYVSADDAKALLMPVLSEYGSIEATKAPEVGVSSTGDLSVKEGGNSMSLHDSIIMRDYPENVADAEDLLARLDVKPLQVLIEATILSATLNEDMEFGIDLNMMAGLNLDGTAATETIVAQDNISRGTAATSPIASIGSITNGTPLETAGFANAGANGLRIGISTGEVRVLITALEAITDVTVLANPKILALNKQVGTVFIGQNLGYRSSTTIGSGGIATSGEVKFLKSGTKLSFRPYIANDGNIRMDIYPKDSSASKDTDGVPTETTAELSANIMVKDGQTVVIGGLFRDSITSSKQQVPLLGNIPFVGELFKGTSDQTVRQEVIILLTPHIIDDLDELEGDKRAADAERKRLGARDALHFLGAGRLAEDSYSKAVNLYSDGDSEAALTELCWTLNLRPTYFEALRLRERIIRETSPDNTEAIERIMLGAIEREETQNWFRR
jgi:type II secretory pathway component GspD/PulD (secretin)